MFIIKCFTNCAGENRRWPLAKLPLVLGLLTLTWSGWSQTLTVTSARRSWSAHTQVTVVYSAAVDPVSGTNAGNYQIDYATVLGAQAVSNNTAIVLTTSSIDYGPPPTLHVSGVANAALSQVLTGATYVVSLSPVMPSEMGTVVNGYQDDFSCATMNTNWVAVGPDVYFQSGGKLNVSAGAGNPNNLVYANPAYQGANQEILARIRLTGISVSQSNAYVGMAVGVPTNSLSNPDPGGMSLVLLNPHAFGSRVGYNFAQLSDDSVAWGPVLNNYQWQTNTWYWVRLQQNNNITSGQTTAYAKVWAADGDTAEPTSWAATYNYSPSVSAARSGYAGLRAGYLDTTNTYADYEVDYVLIEAAGLPAITAMADFFAANPPLPLLQIALQNGQAVVSWSAGISNMTLLTSTNLATWSYTSYPASSNQGLRSVSVPATNPAQFFQGAPQVPAPPPAPASSFNLGGQASSSLLGTWPVSQTVSVLDSNRTQIATTYSQPGSSFSAQVVAINYSDYPANEWVTWFQNSPLPQGFFNDNIGLPNAARTVTFQEHTYPFPATNNPAQSLTTQYADQGLFFDPGSPAYWYSNSIPGNVSGGCIANYQAYGSNPTNSVFTIHFTQPVNSIAFALLAYGTSSALFEALSNGTVVASATASVGSNNTENLYGFRDIRGGFDTVEITPATTGAQLLVGQIQQDINLHNSVSISFDGYASGTSVTNTYAGGGPGGAGGGTSNVWNSVYAALSTPNTVSPLTNFIAADGYPVGLTLSLSNFLGSASFTSGPYGTQNLFADYLTMANSTGPATIQLGGLVPNAMYDLYLFAANDGGGIGAVFTVNGVQITVAGGGAPFLAGGDYAKFTTSADNNGQLTVTVTGEYALGNGDFSSCVNGLQLVQRPPASVSVGLKGQRANAPITYNGPGPGGGNLWNLAYVPDFMPNNPSPRAQFLADDGTPSTVTLTLTSFISADNFTNGPYGEQELFDGYVVMANSNGPAQMTIGGLVPGSAYQLFVFASNDGAGVGGIFSVNGGAQQTARGGGGPFRAGGDYVQFNTVADTNGQLVVTVTGNAPSSGTLISVVNGFQIIGAQKPPPTISVDLNGLGTGDPALLTYSWTNAPGGSGLWNGVTVSNTAPNIISTISGFVTSDGTPASLTLCLSNFVGAVFNNNTGPYGSQNLFEDYLVENDLTGSATLTLGGLQCGALYDLYLFSSDDGSGTGGTFSVNGGTQQTARGGSGPFRVGGDYVKLTAQADGLGRLSVNVSGGNAGAGGIGSVLNGFQLVGPFWPATGNCTAILTNFTEGPITLSRGSGDPEFVLHYNNGSFDLQTDFQPKTATLAPNSTMTLAPNNGLSSDTTWPYFNIQTAQGGLIVAVGWSGQWQASFTRDSSTNLTVQIGMQDFNLSLLPGERIRTPGVFTMSYTGDWLDGQRQFRHFMLAHFTPLFNGHLPFLPIAVDSGVLGNNAVTANNSLIMISNIVANMLPANTWWEDAGWNAAGGFPNGQGTWTPDPVRFPNGMAPIGNAARTNGLRYLLWFEPERVMPGTWLGLNHPEWLLTPTGSGPYGPDPSYYRLLNLGDPTALAWAKKNFSDSITSWGVDIYRQDCNLHPLLYWQTADAVNRVGMTEIRHIMGLYDYWDALQHEHPNLLIDDCASGGRRLDYELARRSLALWRSDYCWEPIGEQGMTYGLSLWFPITGVGSANFTDNYDMASGLGSFGDYAYDYLNPTSALMTPVLQFMNLNLSIQSLFSGDYYPLTPYSTNQTDWVAWQFDRPDLGLGIVQAFRRAGSLNQSLVFQLNGLIPDATYTVTNLFQGGVITNTGLQLMNPGITVRIPDSPDAAILLYQKSQ